MTASTKQEGATYGIAAIDTALDTIASDRASLGAVQSQLEAQVRNLANVARRHKRNGRVMDTDYATETANLTKAQIFATNDNIQFWPKQTPRLSGAEFAQ